MMTSCYGYLENLLNSLGIDRVSAGAEENGKHQTTPRAHLEPGPEKFTYDGSLAARQSDAENMRCTYRRRMYRHAARVDVQIYHRSAKEAAAVKRSFMAALARRIWDADNNAILVSVPESRPEDDPSLLKRQDAAVVTVTFEGGVYLDKTVELLELPGALVIESEIEEA